MRWNRIEDWHITLAFLGELPVADGPAPAAAARGARGGPPPVLALRGGGHFDERVLWSGIDGDLDGLHRARHRRAGRGQGVRDRLRGPAAAPPSDAGPRPPTNDPRQEKPPPDSPGSPAGDGGPNVCTWSAATSAAARARSTTATSRRGTSRARTSATPAPPAACEGRAQERPPPVQACADRQTSPHGRPRRCDQRVHPDQITAGQQPCTNIGTLQDRGGTISRLRILPVAPLGRAS